MNSSLVLDLVIKAFISSPICQDDDKKWESIAKLVPGSTPQECQKRYEELNADHNRQLHTSTSTSSVNSLPKNGPPIRDSSRDRTKVGRTGKNSAGREVKNSTGTGMPSVNQGQLAALRNKSTYNPIMVIHVCDEAKNLKQDFTCQRDLLVQEMQYFAEYLSTDTQRMEEVDISVHCDVQIFDWLMKYVKRSTREGRGSPGLEPSNVISILISSDFLKMDSLVEECIEYCRANMSAIIATPCNMNCIDDRLVSRISDLFDHNELDAVKDRKDKFKSKLFAKKVEKLFESSTDIPGSPENASTLFKCSFCKRILTKNLESKLKCIQSRMTVNRFGTFSYKHVADPSWDISDWLLETRNQLKTWSDVYWYIWGSINYLECSRCLETFPCTELANCRYHPESAVFDVGKSVGEHPCCGVKVLRFDPLQPNKGCRLKDHVVKLPSNETNTDKNSEKTNSKTQVYNDLLAHRDVVCLPFLRAGAIINDCEADVDVYAADEIASGVTLPTETVASLSTSCRMSMSDFKVDGRSGPRLKALTAEREITFDEEETDDEIGDDEDNKVRKPGPRKSKVTLDPQAILLDAPDFSTTKTGKWDTSRSLRYNQDTQREEDQRRMRDMVAYLTRLRLCREKIEKLKQREYAGGIFSKLEAQWKAVNIPPPKLSNPVFRNKPRLGQVLNK